MSLRNNVGYPLNHENTRAKIFLKELKRSVFPYRDFILKFLENYKEEKFDSWLLQEEQMRSDAKGLIAFFLELKKKFGSYIPRKRFEKELEHNTRMIDDWSLRQVERNTTHPHTAVGVYSGKQVQTASGGSASSPTIKTALRNVNIESGSITEQIIKSSIKTNVDLISKLDQEYKNKVEKIIPEKVTSKLKNMGTQILTQAKNVFVAVSQQADTIARAGASAIMDFKQAIIGMDTRIKEAANRLQLWFNSEARKVAEYERQLKAEMTKPESIEKIRKTMERDHVPSLAAALAEARIYKS